MNKDALLATLIGFGIGLCITGLLLVGPTVGRYLPKLSFQLSDYIPTQSKPTTVPTPSQTDFFLSIDSPLSESLESTEEVLISGSTSPNALVIVQGNTNEAAIQTKEDGKYAGKVTLSEGKNDITVTSYLREKQTMQTISVFYTPEEL